MLPWCYKILNLKSDVPPLAPLRGKLSNFAPATVMATRGANLSVICPIIWHSEYNGVKLRWQSS